MSDVTPGSTLEAERIEARDANLSMEPFSNGEGDYINLPQFGAQYFSLEHAALLLALDEWARENSDYDPDFFEPNFDELVSNVKAREESQPFCKVLVQALVRSVVEKELEAVACAKSLSSGRPLPSRTYTHIEAVRKWAAPYGLGSGHLLEHADSLDEEVFDLALAVSRRRRLIDSGIMPAAYEVNGLPPMLPHELIAELTKKIEAKNLQIAHLERKMNSQTGDARPLGSRQKNNLLRLIGAMHQMLSPTYNNKQDALIADIDRQFGKLDGLSKRNLESVFPLAKRLLASE